MVKGKLLAIDYGAKSVGLAVSDAGRQMAFGRGVLVNKNIDQVCGELHTILLEDAVTKILVGLPLGSEGGETDQTAKIRAFAESLSNYLNDRELQIPIEFIDESFSTFEANNILRELGVAGQDRKKTEDEMAAIILIHRYIDFRP